MSDIRNIVGVWHQIQKKIEREKTEAVPETLYKKLSHIINFSIIRCVETAKFHLQATSESSHKR